MRTLDAMLKQVGLTPGGEPGSIHAGPLLSAGPQSLRSLALCLTEPVYKDGMLIGLLTNTSQEN